jgi:hypothetical protein
MNAEAIIPLCTHIKTNGRTCQSPALTGESLCFFHRKLRDTHRRPPTVEALTSYWQESSIETATDRDEDIETMNRVYPRQNQIEFPALEDAESVQLATSMLFQAIATGQIHFKRARLLLYTLKIAVINNRALTLSRNADAASSSAVPLAGDPTPQPKPRHPDAELVEGAEGAQSKACPERSRRNPDGSAIPPHPGAPEEAPNGPVSPNDPTQTAHSLKLIAESSRHKNRSPRSMRARHYRHAAHSVGRT